MKLVKLLLFIGLSALTLAVTFVARELFGSGGH